MTFFASRESLAIIYFALRNPEIAISAESFPIRDRVRHKILKFLKHEPMDVGTAVLFKWYCMSGQKRKSGAIREELAWWAVRDSNPRLPACKAGALTS
jgi:hypothetical protein